jgi:hypothetical protein
MLGTSANLTTCGGAGVGGLSRVAPAACWLAAVVGVAGLGGAGDVGLGAAGAQATTRAIMAALAIAAHLSPPARSILASHGM